MSFAYFLIRLSQGWSLFFQRLFLKFKHQFCSISRVAKSYILCELNPLLNFRCLIQIKNLGSVFNFSRLFLTVFNNFVTRSLLTSLFCKSISSGCLFLVFCTFAEFDFSPALQIEDTPSGSYAPDCRENIYSQF